MALKPKANSHEDGQETAFPVFRAAAGFPSPAEDYREPPLKLESKLIGNEEATFFVRVRGDSMKDEGIRDGDLLIVDRSLHPLPGKIIVAALQDGLVVKRLTEHEILALEGGTSPSNEINSQECIVWGVVTYSIRSH